MSTSKETLLAKTREFKRGEARGNYRRYAMWFLVALVTPYSIAVKIGPLNMTPIRLIAMFFLYKSYTWLRARPPQLSRATLLDMLALTHCGWVILAITINHDIPKALEAGGVYFLEFFPIYAFGRYLAFQPQNISFFIRRLYIAVLIFAPVAYFESFTGTNIVNEIVAKLGFPVKPLPSDPRMGLHRASATMPHPILYGLFASCTLGLACFVLMGSKVKRVLLIFWATFPSLSSAPLLSVSLQMGLITWNYIFRNQARRWYILLGIILTVFLGIEFLSNRDAVTVLMNYLTFNAQTGYWRKLIWEYGLKEVYGSPWFGIGFHDWDRPGFMWSSSVDTFWLLTTMRFGIPSVLCFFVMLGIISKRMITKDYRHLSDYRLGWFISIAGFMLVGVTVHFWASTFVLFAFLLGMGVSISSYRISSPELSSDSVSSNR